MNTTQKDTFEIVLAGSGGQGLVSSGIMLGEAAIVEGKNVIQTTSYGIAQRGGLSKAEVIISKKEILFQHVRSPDIVLALTDESMDLYVSLAKSGVPIFYDTTLVQERLDGSFFGYPLTEMADCMGHKGVANVIALGAMIAHTPFLQVESLEAVLRKRFKGKTLDMNIRALHKGSSLLG
jgi:2-oxoglutarate ferredoxin oxidoreductase subunit gamma